MEAVWCVFEFARAQRRTQGATNFAQDSFGELVFIFLVICINRSGVFLFVSSSGAPICEMISSLSEVVCIRNGRRQTVANSPQKRSSSMRSRLGAPGCVCGET